MAQPNAKSVRPAFSSLLKGTIVEAGQTAKFEAILADTTGKPFEVHWLKDGKKLMNGKRHKLVQENMILRLLISEPVPDDCGTYECVVKNNFGSAQCQAQFLVQAAGKSKLSSEDAEKSRPKIVEPMKALIIQKGQQATFKCKITGKQPFCVKWLKGDKLIESSKHFQISREADTNTLVISDVSAQDEGEYKCAVTNECGSAEVRAPLKVMS